MATTNKKVYIITETSQPNHSGEFIISDVNRVNGEIELTILLPHGANASHEARFPEPINMTNDGQVVLPI
jgi:hypothetical protein